MTFAASLFLGALVGAANAAAAAWTVRRTSGLDSIQSMRLVLGGMMVRMVVVLAVFAVVLATLPVHRAGFVGGLGVLFAVGLAAEILLLLRRPQTSSPADA